MADPLALGVPNYADTNAVYLIPSHQFKGVFLVFHEVLEAPELLQGRWCLNPAGKVLSPDK